MLTTAIKVRLDVPHETWQWVEIRKLPWRKLREASETQREHAYAAARSLGKDGLEAIRNVTAEQIAELKRSQTAQYDPGTLLRAAVTAWSYSDKPTPDELDDLDTVTAEWLVGEIVALAMPARTEADSKNG